MPAGDDRPRPKPGSSTRSAVGGGLPDGHRRTHPRVNAAHVLVFTDILDIRRVRAARGDELEVGEIETRGRGHRIASQVVQLLDEPSAKLGDLGEGMELAATVMCLHRLSFLQLDLTW